METDVSSASITVPKMPRDHITAHKISLMVLAKEFCTVKMKSRNAKQENIWIHSDQQNRDMAITFLKLIQSPDTDFAQLNAVVKPILHPKTYQEFLSRLKEMRSNGIAAVMDYIQTLEVLLTDSTHESPPVLQKSSVIGLFIRRLLLTFDKFSFSHITKLCDMFNVYYDTAFGSAVVSNESIQDSYEEESSDRKKKESQIFASQKQAEFFIAQQTALLQINEKEALSPKELQQKICELLKGNSALSEAHYLSFLNTLRVKDYCGALENMYHHFDRNSSLPHDTKASIALEDTNRSYRYGALNLALLHARFGHKEEALAALREAIMVAQEVNDNVCLQYALTWLYRLSKENTENLIERSVSKAAELNLWYLSSLGIQALSQMKCITTATPSNVFEMVMKGDVLNCQHSMTEVMGTAYAQRAALWTHYGNCSMADLTSQLLLFLNTSDPVRGSVYHIGEGTCLSIRNLVSSFALEGNIDYAMMMLTLAKDLFPVHSEHSHIWKICELVIGYEKALYSRCWSDAEKCLEGITVFDVLEAEYRTAQLYLSQGNLGDANIIMKKLVQKCKNKDISPHFHVRVLLLKAMLFCQTPNFHMAIAPLMMGVEVSQMHHLFYLRTMCILWIAYIQLMLGLPRKAMQMLDGVFISFLSHGSSFDKGCCYMLYAKCFVVAIQNEQQEENKGKALTSAVLMVNKAIEYFMKVHAVHQVKYAYYWQAHLYNQLGLTAKRNLSSLRFKTLHIQYPSTNLNCLLIP